MKNQTNRMLIMLLIAGFVLLGIGCSGDTSKNNQNIYNQNTAGQNTSDEDEASQAAAPPVCTSVTEAEIKAEIPRLPDPLRDQFKEINPQTGNISLSYNPQLYELIFKGYIHGDGVNLRGLLNRFNKFRGRQCARKVLFQGETATSNFEWRPDPNSPTPTPPNVCKQDVDNEINNGILKSQLNHNLTFDFVESTKILTLTGYIGDNPQGNGKFHAFIGQLQRFMRNGCISKIEFGPAVNKDPKMLLNRGFEWQICEYPECENNGVCVRCVVKDIDPNTNSNSNTNTP